MKNCFVYLALALSLTLSYGCKDDKGSNSPTVNPSSGLPTYPVGAFEADKAKLDELTDESIPLATAILAGQEPTKDDLTFFEGLRETINNIINKYGNDFRYEGDPAEMVRYLIGKEDLVKYRDEVNKLIELIQGKLQAQEANEEETQGESEGENETEEPTIPLIELADDIGTFQTRLEESVSILNRVVEIGKVQKSDLEFYQSLLDDYEAFLIKYGNQYKNEEVRINLAKAMKNAQSAYETMSLLYEQQQLEEDVIEIGHKSSEQKDAI